MGSHKELIAASIWHVSSWLMPQSPLSNAPPSPFWSNFPLCVIMNGALGWLPLQRLLGAAWPIPYLANQEVNISCRVSSWTCDSWILKQINVVSDDWSLFHSCHSTKCQRRLAPGAQPLLCLLLSTSRDPWVFVGLSKPIPPFSSQSWDPNTFSINASRLRN